MASKRIFPSISYMGEGAMLIAFGNRVSAELRDRVYTLYHSLHDIDIQGVTDLVPAYASLLIKFNPLSDAGGYLLEVLPDLLRKPVRDLPVGRHHVVPVKYGGEEGPDLEALANLHGLTSDEAIKLHMSRPYSVYFLGFLPGFAYMGRVVPKLVTPRLKTPRVRVPAGSVAIAGVQTSVYPFNSPGGWQLIGQTGVQVWDPTRREPSLFAHGDTVQFAATNEISHERLPAASRFVTPNPVFRVREAGVLTTIQDLGRSGQAHLGLSTGGVCDPYAAMRANALVGNGPGAAVLEITWGGPKLEVLVPCTIALDGADLGCRVDGMPVPPGLGWFVRAGALVSFVQMSPSGAGARAFLTVAGGFDAPEVLHSRSTCLPAGFGGYEGRALRSGDILGLALPPGTPAQVAGHYWTALLDPALKGVATLRFVRYTGVASAGAQAVRQLSNQGWRVSPQSDRIGVRFEAEEGDGINFHTREATSFGVVRGAIQVPPEGKPVVLSADHQTTGGYPLAGIVTQADWPLLAQLRPGDAVRFAEISHEEALTALGTERTAFLAGLTRVGLGARERDYALV